MQAKKGILLVVSGPSGVGKGTICKQLLRAIPGLELSVSVTTRSPRAGEEDGLDYHFISSHRFEKMVAAGELLEWAHVFGNFYGTPRQMVEDVLAQGKDILLEIDIQGALQVKAAFPECVLLFIWPPSLQELEKRIRGRGTETEGALSDRLHKAKLEMAHGVNYDYIITNYPNQVAGAVYKIECILTAERNRVGRLLPQLQAFMKEDKKNDDLPID